MLGIDLGGTTARAALVSAEGRILGLDKRVLGDRSPEAVVETIARAAAGAMEVAGSDGVRSCGVGVAGQLRGETGHIAVAPNLGWRDVPFGVMLSERLGRPVRVVNDLSAAAWGELTAGAARGHREVFVVFVGSGVGSALISRGQLIRGARGVAGELGHIKVVARGGRVCGCGELGCLEAYAGGHNLIALMREALMSGAATVLRDLVDGDPSRLNPAVLEQAALTGDPVARDIYDRAAELLGVAIANQVTVLNPSQLILGGGVLLHCPELLRRVVEAVGARSSWVSRQELRIATAELGDDSGLIGAALLSAESG